MVAQTVNLPNLRKMFIPDDGYVMVDCDLERADAQIVAWEAGDEILKQMFREGVDIHTENAKVVFRVTHPTYDQRQKAKQGIHAIHYVCTARTLAIHLGVTVHEAENFIRTWFSAHPAIPAWHKRVRSDLDKTRTVKNIFGFRITFFDRPEELLPAAVAWIPQSTVAICTNKGIIQVEDDLPSVHALLQVHDSAVFQAPLAECPNILHDIRERMEVKLPYPDPLTIPVGLSASSKSWGDVIEFSTAKKVWKAHDEGLLSSKWAAEELKLSPGAIEDIMQSRIWYEKAAA